MRSTVAPRPAPMILVPLFVTRSGFVMLTVPAGRRMTPPLSRAARIAVSVSAVFGATTVVVVADVVDVDPPYCGLVGQYAWAAAAPTTGGPPATYAAAVT